MHENPGMPSESTRSDGSCAGEAANFRLTFAGRSDLAAAELERLTIFAESMCEASVARLRFGSGDTRPRLGLIPAGETRALIHIYNEQGRLDVYVCPYRSVFERVAPSSIASVEAAAGLTIGHGNAIHDVSDRLLGALEAALREAHSAYRSSRVRRICSRSGTLRARTTVPSSSAFSSTPRAGSSTRRARSRTSSSGTRMPASCTPPIVQVFAWSLKGVVG